MFMRRSETEVKRSYHNMANVNTPGKPPQKKRGIVTENSNKITITDATNMKTNMTNNTDLHTKMDNIIKTLEKLDMLEKITTDIAEMKHSLEYAHSEIVELKNSDVGLKRKVDDISMALTKNIETTDYQREAILDIQTRSMRDNVVFSGIVEREGENVETVLKDFIRTELAYTKNVEFERAHRIGKQGISQHPRHRLIVAKFSSFKTKEEVRRCGPKLAGKPYGVSEQFPEEIMRRRRELLPILRKAKRQNHKAVISVDKLYINGTRYRPSQGEILKAKEEEEERRNVNTRNQSQSSSTEHARSQDTFQTLVKVSTNSMDISQEHQQPITI